MIIRKLNLNGLQHLLTLKYSEGSNSRKYFYLPGLMKQHPSKNSVKLTKYLIKQYTQEYQHIFDPMIGIGTTLVEGIKLNRCVTGCDIFPNYIDISKRHAMLAQKYIKKHGFYRLHWYPGNLASDILPKNFFHLVLFSPPYGLQNHSMGNTAYTRKIAKEKHLYSCIEYGNSSSKFSKHNIAGCKNIGQYYDKMKELLNQCVLVTKKNGHICIILQDYIRKGLPVGIVQKHIDMMLEHEEIQPIGYYTRQLHLSYYKQMLANRGYSVIAVEHTLVFRKDKKC